MDVVTIDFETYYDKEYSLSKITTEEYIRDSRFEVIGVAAKLNDERTQWYSGDDVAGFLNQVDYSDKAILAHNTVFDGAILSWRYGIRPRLWLDTLSMSRPLTGLTVSGSLKMQAAHYSLGVKGDEVINALGMRRQHFHKDALDRYAAYCINDVDLTYDLFKTLRHGFSVSEIMLIDRTIRMFTEPEIELDADLLVAHLQDVLDKKSTLMDQMGMTDATEDEVKALLRSNNKFAAYLESLGVSPPTKISPTTGKVTYAFSKTDKQFKDMLNHPNTDVANAVAARLGVKTSLEETRTQRMLDIAHRGTLPIMLMYYGAHTGRFSGCLVADTVVDVFDTAIGVVMQKRIVDVLPDDLVWDGEEYVEHDGVVFSGYREVIEWDGITGTEEHVVFTADGGISLAEAKARGSRISLASSPSTYGMDSTRTTGEE